MHAKLQMRAAAARTSNSPGRVSKSAGKRKKGDANAKPRREGVSAVDAAALLTMFR